MAIIAPQTAPNFATGNYFRILKVEIICGPTEPCPRYQVMLGFYASSAARDSNVDPMYTYNIGIPFTNGVEDPRVKIYELLMGTELFVNTNAAPDASPSRNPALDTTVPVTEQSLPNYGFKMGIPAEITYPPAAITVEPESPTV